MVNDKYYETEETNVKDKASLLNSFAIEMVIIMQLYLFFLQGMRL